MPTYRLIVTRDITESAHVKVIADNEDEACDMAIEHAYRGLPWEIDCNSHGKEPPYITACELITLPPPHIYDGPMSEGLCVICGGPARLNQLHYYNACVDPCDTTEGPCACGAWHKAMDFNEPA